MVATSPRITLKARWVFPGNAPPIPDGSVTLWGQQIVAVGAECAEKTCLDLGNVAILPGLVNAHTHLELSDLDWPLGAPGIGMAEWIRLVIQSRGGRRAEWAIRRGIAETLRQGVTAVGEIAQADAPREPLEKSPLDSVAMVEVLGPTPARAQAAMELAGQYFSAGAGRHGRVGISPHAPYTVHPQLLRAAVAVASQQQLPLAFHLAESREEMQFLHDGSGPLRELLEERGGWDPELVRPGARPLDYLRLLAAAPRVLIIHGNYLDEEEIAFLARHRGTMSVVYCPRTHAWFRHARYPLEQLLAAGCSVALGTDSRASVADLSLLAEMQAAARAHPEIPRCQILHLATLGGAQALGLSSAGSLEPERDANLTIVALPTYDADPHELLFASEARVVGRWWHGVPE
jgi:cytosine/adenosine deaminase-related metal-dependent hydrolase